MPESGEVLSSRNVQRALAGLLVVLVAAIAVVLVVGRPSRSSTSSASGQTAASTVGADGLEGNSLPAHLLAANFTLTDQNGHRMTFDRSRGHVVVLTFIYTHCRNSCPFMVEQIKGALNSLPDHGRGVRVIGVSVQPRRDTAADRRRFIADHEMTGRMEFLDGPMATMRRIWKAYGIQAQTRQASHSAFVIVIDKRGYEKVGFPAVQLTPNQLAFDIRKLQARSA